MNVNAIGWNGSAWMLAGGAPIAQLLPNSAWAVTYSSAGFVNISPSIRTHIVNGQNSSLLAVAFLNDSWILGGYSSNHGLLLSYRDDNLIDLSCVVEDMSYVTWIGAGSVGGGQPKDPIKISSAMTDTVKVLGVIFDLIKTDQSKLKAYHRNDTNRFNGFDARTV